MAPPAADVDLAPETVTTLPVKTLDSTSTNKGPLKYSGSLDQYPHVDVTNVIGREFVDLQLSQILGDDNKLRDLAITGGFPI